QVKGRKHEFMIYELMGIRASDDPELNVSVEILRLCEMTREASSHFEQGDFDVAAQRYAAILRAYPEDPVARSLLAICRTELPLAESPAIAHRSSSDSCA